EEHSVIRRIRTSGASDFDTEATPLVRYSFALPGLDSRSSKGKSSGPVSGRPSSALRSHIPKGAVVVGEIAGVENLKTGIVFTVEERLTGGTAGVGGGLRRVKPQSEVIHLNRIERRVQSGVIGKNIRRSSAALRKGKSLDIEPPHELSVASS